MMNNPMEIFRSADGQVQIAVRAEQQNVWLRMQQIADIFGRDTLVSLQHLKNACTKGELAHGAVVAKSASGFYQLQPAQVPRNTLRSVALCCDTLGCAQRGTFQFCPDGLPLPLRRHGSSAAPRRFEVVENPDYKETNP